MANTKENEYLQYDDEVFVDIPDSIKGLGKIVGVSKVLDTGNVVYIVESLTMPIPNETYRYPTIDVIDTFLQPTKRSMMFEHFDRVAITKIEFIYKLKGDFKFIELPFADIEDKYALLMLLPVNIYYSVLQNGLCDTDTSDRFFSFMIKNQFGFNSYEEYIESDIAKQFFEGGKTVAIDFIKLQKELWASRKELIRGHNEEV